MAIDNINTTDNLNTGRVKLNQAIDQANLSEIDSATAIATADTAVVIANTADAKSTTTQGQLDTIVIASGTSDAETIQARGGEPLLYNRLDKVDAQMAEMAQQTDFDVRDFGASISATWQVNQDAFQQANDACYSVGGGRVLIPNGKWTVKGVWQDSHVEFYGKGATLVHPDGLTANMISSRNRITTGSIDTGGTALTVASTDNIEVGTLVAIRGAGGKSIRQSSTLASTITSTDTTIPITSVIAFANIERGIIGNEIIAWTGISGNSFTGVQRGMFGTTAVSHAIGDVLYQACRHYTVVNAINDNVLTVDTIAIMGVTNAEVTIGIISPKITNLNFDGKRILPNGGDNIVPVIWSLVRYGIIDKGEYKNGELGAIQLLHGSRDCIINMPVCKDTGKPTIGIGSVIWMFRGCCRNTVIAPILFGDCYNGIYIDDRTSTSTEWDASCDDNTIIAPNINIKRNGSNSGVNIVGSQRNKVIGGNIRGTRSGGIINSNQSYTHDGSKVPAGGNLISGVSMSDLYYSVSLSAKGNRISNCAWDKTVTMQDTGGNIIENCGQSDRGDGSFSQVEMPIGYNWAFPTLVVDVSSAISAGRLMVAPFEAPRLINISEIGMEVVTGGSGGTRGTNGGGQFRFGIYFDDGFGKPDIISYDFGALYVDGGVAGVQYIQVARTIKPGKYWIGVVMQGNPTTQPILRINKGSIKTIASTNRPVANEVTKMGYGYDSSPNGLIGVFANPIPIDFIPRLFINVTT